MPTPRRPVHCLFIAALLAAAIPAFAARTPQQLQAACRADSASGTPLDKVQIRQAKAEPGDLPYYEARSEITGNSVRIYHAPDLDAAASSKAACLMGMLDLLAAGLPHLRGALAWSPLVLTHDAQYIPPKRDGELRWATVFRSISWEPANLRFLVLVMPHEETHLGQAMGGERLPRWFSEGHAEWAGAHVSMQASPALAAAARAGREGEAGKLGAPRLGAWGGLRVKPEAIDRQLSAADRARRAADPSFTPPGPYHFGPDDLVEDNADEGGRYGAALALFTGLEQRHGRDAVEAWVRAVLEGKDPAQIVPLARTLLAEDLAPLLR